MSRHNREVKKNRYQFVIKHCKIYQMLTIFTSISTCSSFLYHLPYLCFYFPIHSFVQQIQFGMISARGITLQNLFDKTPCLTHQSSSYFTQRKQRISVVSKSMPKIVKPDSTAKSQANTPIVSLLCGSTTKQPNYQLQVCCRKPRVEVSRISPPLSTLPRFRQFRQMKQLSIAQSMQKQGNGCQVPDTPINKLTALCNM